MATELRYAEIRPASRRDVDAWRVALSSDLAVARDAVVSRLDRGVRRTVLALSLLMVATAAAALILLAAGS